jgi:ketosteroid isomerase-like protein
MSTTAMFDVAALRRGMAQRDAASLNSLYADDAEIVSTSAMHPPSRPRTLRGRDAIAECHAELVACDMHHDVEQVVVGPDSVAFTVACSYPDGKRVRCVAIAELAPDGRIVRQIDVSSWD